MPAISSLAELRSVYKPANPRSVAKAIPQLDGHCRRFIALSPFLVLSTGGPDGTSDVSPRGDGPGFVAVEDDHTLLLPDRPGNNRLDSLENIIARPGVALLFLIPGVDETLRVNGTAQIHTDEDLKARFIVQGKLPLSVIRITVHEAYLHCAKALMRAQLWNAEHHVERSVLPTMGQMMEDHTSGAYKAESQEEMLKRYKDVMY